MIKAVDMEYIADRITIFLIRIYKLKFLGFKYFANKTNNVKSPSSDVVNEHQKIILWKASVSVSGSICLF